MSELNEEQQNKPINNILVQDTEVKSMKDWNKSYKHTKRTHIVSQSYEERKKQYAELKEMRQKIKGLKAEKIVQVTICFTLDEK